MRQSLIARNGQQIDALAGNVDRLISTFERAGRQSENEQIGQRINALTANIDRLIGVLERSGLHTDRHSAHAPNTFVPTRVSVIENIAIPTCLRRT